MEFLIKWVFKNETDYGWIVYSPADLPVKKEYLPEAIMYCLGEFLVSERAKFSLEVSLDIRYNR